MTPRHPAFVRLTHWISALSFLVLALSGLAILLAHPRLYWGETGAVGGPSLIDLPLPFVLDVPIRGPGRYLHFLAAWVSVFTGLLYVAVGLARRHFSRNVLPSRTDLTPGALRAVVAGHLRFRRSTRRRPSDLQRPATAQLFCGGLRSLPLDDLDRARDVARGDFRLSLPGIGPRRTTVRKDAPLRRGGGSRALRPRPRGARLPDRVQEPHEGHDHGDAHYRPRGGEEGS